MTDSSTPASGFDAPSQARSDLFPCIISDATAPRQLGPRKESIEIFSWFVGQSGDDVFTLEPVKFELPVRLNI